ncbi:MAG: hypothetical protein ACE37J_19715 [Pikeienuella sp.]|uniref:hypothetical protein n=1 Tax=Pikeienuella sp. TaxID=2831957 RepID=UPI00391A6553
MLEATTLGDLDPAEGFRIDGEFTLSRTGVAVAVGDVNGDGFADFIVGAPQSTTADPSGGKVHVIFGTASGLPAATEVAALDGVNGFTIVGETEGDEAGFSLAAGDVNGDGIDDIVVGARYAATNGAYSGAAYVVFGKTDAFGQELSLSSLNGDDGFRFLGGAGDQAGRSVAAGDVNGDGIDDVLIGAIGESFNALDYAYAGAVHVIFGTRDGFYASSDAGDLNGGNGFTLFGQTANGLIGYSVSVAGDVNGDGIEDIMIGAPGFDYNGPMPGSAFVVFGAAAGPASPRPAASILSSFFVEGTQAFRIGGSETNDLAGTSVSSAGDVNGDGFDDLIVGAPGADGSTGAAHVVFGKAGGFGPVLDPSTLDGTNGFRIVGADAYDEAGAEVASAGDVNNDGFDDILVFAPSGGPAGTGVGPGASGDRAATYLIFGKAGGFAAEIDLGALTAADGLRFDSANVRDNAGQSLAAAGDLNGDGFDDVLFGAPGVGLGTGAAFALFGGDVAEPPVSPPTTPPVTPPVTPPTTPPVTPPVTPPGTPPFTPPVAPPTTPPVTPPAGPTPGDDNLSGTGGPDRIAGLAGDDTVRGRGGDDTLLGQAGEDILRGGRGDDSLVGGGGADRLFGQGANDTLKGGGAADFLKGGGGADRIVGGGGADTIEGGKGADTMIGGGGPDTFRFAPGDGADVILRFRQGADQIEFKRGVSGFDALTIEQQGDDVLVSYTRGSILFENQNAGAFGEEDFLF